jgi:alpha-mannosidase
MRTNSLLLPALLSLSAVLFLGAARGEEPAKPQGVLWVIPHTHWEGAVFKTREEYLDVGLPHILEALRLLKTQPSYRFVLDQVAYVRPFLERYPEEAAAFRKFVAEGRLQLVLGMDVMPDVNMPGGETCIRQILYGKDYYREHLGVDVTNCWLIDTFGHHAQLPQLLRLAGYKTFWFSRGVPSRQHPSEFLWEGIDGTQIPAFWLPHSYGLMYNAPKDLAHFEQFVKGRYELLGRYSHEIDRVALSGVDVSEPEEHLAPMIEAYNRKPNQPLRLTMAVPSDFEAVVAGRKNLKVFRGELNPIFQGTYSSRIEIKQEMRDMERVLTTAETLGVLAERLGGGISERTCWPAWEPVLFNETHDLASGVMTDHVYEDTLASYAFSRRLANEWIEKLREQIAAKIDTRGSRIPHNGIPHSGIPIIVFNTLGWPRTDVAEATVGIADPGIHSFRVEDAEGKEVPVQPVETTRRKDGGIETARLIFLARDVPALGYCVFHAIPQKDRDHPERETAPSVDGEFYRLTIDPSTGAVTSLVEKAGGRELLFGPANVISRETDKGDLWELYQGLDGGSAIAMKRKQPIPRSGQAKLTSEVHGPPQKMHTGSVFAEFRVSHPFDTGTFETRIRCYQGLPRIEISTTLVNNEKYVRYQALFPTAVARGKIVHSIPFGSIERPQGIEFPAQDWVDYSDGQGGLALLNRGLPGNLTTDGTMMVSLLRSHTLGAYGFGGGYEPGMSSESGRQLGKARTVQYALYPHVGDWRAAQVFRAGLEFNRPLIAAKATTHTGELPQRWGLLEVTPSDVVVSALKPGRDGTAILRVYEAAGRPAKSVAIQVGRKLASARECNLLEDAGQPMSVENNTFRFDLRGFEIKTFELRIQ